MNNFNKKFNEFEESLLNKKIAIVGMGVSNIPLIDYFSDKQVEVTVFDDNEINDEIQKKINQNGYSTKIGRDKFNELKNYDIIFRSPSILPSIPEIKDAINNGVKVTSEIELVIELAPCKIIGVTGTEGKTTTTTLIYEILKYSGNNCFLGGNMGYPLFTKILEMKASDIIALELSSFQLMDMEISPSIAVVTNIYPDHLNFHSSYEEYQEAKKNIFIHQDANEKVILNYDNEITRTFVNDVKSNVIFFSSKEKLSNGYIYDKDDGFIKYINNGFIENIISKADIKVKGIHNYENICVALAATDTIVDRKKQIEAIKNFKGVEHRLEYVKTINGVKYYNDSIGTSPASTIAGLNSFDENIILIAGGSDKGLDYTEIGKKIAEKVSTLILTGPTSEKIEKATKDALKDDMNQINIINCANLEEAVLTAKNVAVENDIVLLSPASASFDAFKNFIERGNKFKELVNKL